MCSYQVKIPVIVNKDKVVIDSIPGNEAVVGFTDGDAFLSKEAIDF